MTVSRYSFLLLVTVSHGFKLQTGSSSQLSLPFSLKSATDLPLPQPESAFGRYCHVDSLTVNRLRDRRPSLMEYGEFTPQSDPSVFVESLMYGNCSNDDDCAGAHSRPFCIEGMCRECRSGYEFEDCGTSSALCASETGFTCSQCGSDDDCNVGTVCRTVFDKQEYLVNHTMARKSCNHCESVPPFGEITNTTQCEWRCPIDTFYSPQSEDSPESCIACPMCTKGQYYAPADSPNTFFSTCTNATNVICSDCASIGIDSSDENFCAEILSPNESNQDSLFVGDLGPQFPCRFFQCKSGWFLDHSLGKCKRCHLSMCPPGQTLTSCGDNNPGRCVPCPNSRHKPRTAEWIVPTDPGFAIKQPLDTCQFICPEKTIYNPDDNACIRCDPGAPSTDPLACVDSSTTAYRIE